VQSRRRLDAAAADGGLPRATRVLKRRASEARPDEATAQNMMCVWGGHVTTPVIIYPIHKALGTTWFTLSEHSGWLRRVCSKKGLTHYKDLFQSAVSALRRELQGAIHAVERPDPAADIRAAMKLDTDASDGDAPAACPTTSRRKHQPVACSKILSVKLGDDTIRIQSRLRPIRVEVQQAAVNTIIAWCRSHVQQNKPVLKKHQVSAACPSWSMPADACPTILGKVTWQPSHHGFCVHAKSSDGRIEKKRIKVKQPSKMSGAHDEFQANRMRAYMEAIDMWNKYDCSTRERIPVPSS
jgi:hypothetical protein